VFRQIVFNRPDSFTFSGTIGGKGGFSPSNAGMVVQNGSGTLTLTGTNTYLGGTTVSNGTIVVTGAIGTGPVNVFGALTFSNSSTTLNVPGAFSGTGPVVMGGSGMVTMNGAKTNFTGSITVSNGILTVANATGGDVNVSGGTLAAGGFKAIGTLTLMGGNLNINSGTVSMSLNKALAQSNSFAQVVTNAIINFNVYPPTTNYVIGNVNYTGGTLQLINVGPTPVVGDKFVLFSKAIPGGTGIPIATVGGFTVNNNLAVDGSVSIASVATPPAPKINNISLASGTNLVISATNNSGPGGSWDLLSTNDLTVPLTNWPIVRSGTFDVNGNLNLTNPLGTNTQQFFNLRAP
jgi:autotransporter-associated beta strand protein